MCQSVYIDGVEHSIQYQLEQAVGKANVRLLDGYAESGRRGALCLCPIDLDFAAASIGRVAVSDGMDYEFVRPGEKPKSIRIE